MFTCSICDETFVGVHQDSIYTTHCGHVFHYHCLKTWLERANTCPHCRSNILEKNLIKLFLQVDPNARVTWNSNVEEKINSFKDQLRILHEKDDYSISAINNLQNQLKHSIEQNDGIIQLLKLECEDYKSGNCHLRNQIKDQNQQNIIMLETQKIHFETELELEKTKNKSLEKNLYEVHSINSVVVDKLKLEIADLKAEKAYFQSRCHNLENKNSDIPSTSKVNVINEKVASREIQNKNEFYGHDPLLKLSSKYFLLGCVFLIVEDRNQYEDICNDTYMSMLNIIEHGGSVEQSYSSRITHLICVSQKNLLVEQGLRDGKRCVTDYWLCDVLAKRIMLPPWLAYHFPTPYSVETGLPCPEFQIVIANFDVNENHMIQTMIELIGGHVVNEVSSSTDVIVSLRLEGEMVERALALNRPVVNVQWLNDILFGAKFGIKGPKNNRYQQFDLQDPFSVNYEMVSNLMDAWKTPVIFLKNEKVHDLTECPDSPLKHKRQKTTAGDPEVIDLVDDDDNFNDNDIIITYFNNKDKAQKPCVTFCGFTVEELEEQNRILLQLGGLIANECKQATHLVMKSPSKTIKLLSCLSTVNHIINEYWLKDSNFFSKFQDENKYSVKEIYEKSNIVCFIPKVLANPVRQQLFKYLTFFVTPGVKFPPVAFLKEIIMSAGGTVETERRSLRSIQNSSNNYLIIADSDDYNMLNDLLKINYVTYSPDFVINSVMNQCLEPQVHSMSTTTQE